MPDPKRAELKVQTRRVVLVAVLDPREPFTREEALDEMRGLVQTAGALVVGEVTQNRNAPDAATYIGKGKLAELRQLIADERADMVVAGCAILEAILDIWPAETLGIADRGIRERILRSLMARDGYLL